MRVHVSEAKESDAGIGIGGVLQIVFIVLKLCGLIDWSWWWVWSPTLIGIGFFCIVLLIAVIARWFLDKRGRYYL